jgi:predicted nucleotidyltransferase
VKRIEAATQITHQDRDLLAELKRVIQHHLPDALVALYGSVARGAAGPESDYDVLVLTKAKPPCDLERELDRAVYDLQLARDVVLSVMIYTFDQWRDPMFRPSPYRKNVMREGIIL